MNDKNTTTLKEQRLQKLFDDCQQQVISQIMGPFGLSPAMFKDVDKNGGNVTTLNNFSREDDNYVATEDDKILHHHAHSQYSKDVRKQYEVSKTSWDNKRDDRIRHGVDEYTGHKVDNDGNVQMPDGSLAKADLDHVAPIKNIHNNKKIQLGLGQVENGEVDVEAVRNVTNDDKNLALTNGSLNRSKKDHDLKEWQEREKANGDGSTNAEHYDLDPERSDEKYEAAREHIDSTANRELLKKQATELLSTGGKQAALMGARQALGLLLTELVNALFTEVKTLIRHGIEAGKSLLDEIGQRLKRAAERVARKAPEALSQMIQGGVSGFVSNLLTFLINNFLSTAKRLVTMIREGLLGLFRAFKMIFFPPKDMTKEQALQAGLKLLGTVIISSVGILLSETVSTFMATVPFLKPFSDLLAPVLIGIISGLLSAFLAYQIDCWFDSHARKERLLDELSSNAKQRAVFATELATLSEFSLGNVERYTHSIESYRQTNASLGNAGRKSSMALNHLKNTVSSTREQVEKSQKMTGYINESQAEIDAFLNKL